MCSAVIVNTRDEITVIELKDRAALGRPLKSLDGDTVIGDAFTPADVESLDTNNN